MASFRSSDAFDQKLNLQNNQAASLPKGLRYQWVKTPSQSAAGFGSQFIVTFNTKDVVLHDLWLEFYCSALSGLTVTTGDAWLVPAPFWVQRAELQIGTLTLDTTTDISNFLMNQLFAESQARADSENKAMGNYASSSDLTTKSASAGYWYVPLWSVFKQASVPLLSSQDVTLRITMNSLSSLYTYTSGQTCAGTPAVTINSCNLLTRVTHLTSQMISQQTALMRRAPLDFAYTETKVQSFSISSGVSTYTATLTGIVGYCPFLIFCVRSSSPTGGNFYTWNATVTQYEILDGGSTNIVGGTAILADQNRYLAPRWAECTFLYDNDQIFVHSFAENAGEVARSAYNLGGFNFRGSEQLKITFSTSLSAAAQLDVIAPSYAALEVNGNQVRKISLSG